MTKDTTEEPKGEQKRKASYVGVPAIYKLEMAARHILDAYRHYGKHGYVGLYLVGSALQRSDWRDLDIVLMLDDVSFFKEFPGAHPTSFEWHDKWILHCVALSEWLATQVGHLVDFKIQPMDWANERHKGRRHPLGLRFTCEDTIQDNTTK